MGPFGIAILVLTLLGALASWIVGAVYYARSLRSLETAVGEPWAILCIIAWPFATRRIAAASSDTAAVVNKALVALIVCLTLGMTTISVSTNFNRVSK
ncbi:MAG: hypothetical protein J0H17_02605 [Rhizobiales bacterium]|jgi:hypothetical protein|nr:hypothetical protein [Hyphomicrobiales bacterium]